MVGAAVTDTARALLHLIESYGGRVEIEGGEPRLSAPVPLPAEIVDAAREHRAELLKLFTGAAEAPTPIHDIPDLGDAQRLRAAWAGAARELGELCGYPRLPFAPAHSIAPGEALWGKFVHMASVPDLRLVVTELRRRVSQLPSPSDGFGEER